MQRSFAFLSALPPPAAAPSALVARVESEAEAVAVSIALSGHKQEWIARQLGRSPAWLSRVRNGSLPVPGWMLTPFCAMTRTTLLRQYQQLQQAIAVVEFKDSAKRRVERLADELRRAAA